MSILGGHNRIGGTYDVPLTYVGVAGSLRGHLLFTGDGTFARVENLILEGGTVGGTGTTNIDGDFEWRSGALGYGGNSTNSGTINLRGTTNLVGEGTKSIGSGNFGGSTVVNYGAMTWTGTGEIRSDPGGRWINEGTIRIQTDAQLGQFDGLLRWSNPGTIIKEPDPSNPTMGVGSQLFSLEFLENTGTIELNAGTLSHVTRFGCSSQVDCGIVSRGEGALNLNGGDLASTQRILLEDGVIAGSGTITASIQQNGGVISPGNSPGHLSINGNLNATAGTLLIDVAGAPIDGNGNDAAGTQFDRVNVSGSAEIADLHVRVASGYQPTLNDRYVVLTGGSVTGPVTDNADSLGMTVFRNDATIELEVTASPNSPPIANSGGPYVVDEGSPFQLNATGSTDPDQSATSLQYEWDFDYDGVTFVPDAVGSQVTRTTAESAADPFQYAVRVTDDEGLSDFATASVTVRNVAPNLNDALGNPRIEVTVDSLSAATLTGQFDDPGNDTHSVSIDWGDGSTVATLNLNAGDRSFSATHSYPQTGGEQSYTVLVTVLDDDLGSDNASTEVLISNRSVTLQGVKFEDRNANGVQDSDERGLSGWTIELVNPTTDAVVDTVLTTADGSYEFTGVTPGDYLIREVQQPGWRQTSPVGDIRRVSLDATGIEAGLHSDSPAVSADGRFIAFTSLAENLVAGDTNGWRDVFVKDTLTGTVQRVSVAIDGSQANGPSYQPSISANGNVVVFRSLASNLVQDDRNDAGGIFVFDRRNSETRQISVNLNPGEADDESYAPAISGDGRFVAFSSTASNLVPDDTNQVADIFLFDLATDLIQRVSVSDSGDQADLESYQPSISHDGRFVAFTSASRTFESADRDGDLDVYLYDRARQSVEWISKSFSGVGGDGPAFDPAISADGQFVGFASSAANLFPGDLNLETDVFIAETSTGRLQRITHGDGPSSNPSLDLDGSKVLFTSYASDLVEGDTNSGPDIFVYDRPLAYFDRLGQSPDGNVTEHVSIESVFSSDGSAIAYASSADNLVALDGNAARDVFIQRAVGVHFVTLNDDETIAGLNFGNQFRLSTIGGQKYADQNGNGRRDADTETGEFLEPGIDGWTIRLVDSRSGQSWETITESIDLNDDGVIDPNTESGIYEFGSLPPGDYEVFELTQGGWFPTFPRLVLTPPANFQAAPNNNPPVNAVDPDSRIFVPRDIPGRVAGPSLPIAPVQFVPAVADGTPEQLPILYVKGFNDDGVGWSEAGQYFTSLADVTDGQDYVKASAGIESYGIQFWGKDNGNPNLTDDDSQAYLKTLEELANPNESFHKPNALEFLLESGESIFSNLTNPAQWIPECESLLDLSTCTIPALTFDFQAARSDYNTNGLARYHAQNLVDLLAEDLGKNDELEQFSQVNFVTHSAGGLDTRAMLALLQQSSDRALQESVANVIYTAPPFGGSTLAELLVPFFEESSWVATLAYPWAFEVLTDLAVGPFETLITAFIAEPIAQAKYNLDNGISGAFDSVIDRINVLPTDQEISDAIKITLDDLDNLIKTVSGQVTGTSFGITEIDQALTGSTESITSSLILSTMDDLIIPLAKQFMTTVFGLPANPKLKDDLRPYEAIHSNLNQFAPNLDVPQFVVWGEGGFLRYATQMGGLDTPLPTPVNLGPPLEEAAANPNSLHAYGDADRNNLDFSNQDIQPGDGNLSRTSALFLTDMAGGYMKALAGFDRHTHGSINSNFFGEESEIQGSFLANDEDDTASIGEVLVETFLTPVTALEISQAAHVVDEASRLYRLGSAAEISFSPEDREFMDIYERRFQVTASAVEYRIDLPGSAPTSWQVVDHETFDRSISDIVSGLAIESEQPFSLEWRSVNQHGGKEAIRSAQFIIDTSAPSLNQIDVIDAESPADTSQIALPSTTSPSSLLDSGRVFGQLGDSAITQVLASQSIDRVVSLKRDKTIRLTFDSPATIQYAWNDPQLAGARASTLGDPNGGTLELLIKKRIVGEIQTPGLGVDYLHEGVQTLYYRASDDSGNSTSIQSLTVLVDDTAPMLEFTAVENEIVGRDTPLSFFATDIGAGIGNASIDVPGVGTLRNETTFSIGETNLHQQVSSGAVVSLTAGASDRVANSVTENYQVIYDYLAPTIEIVDVTSSVILLDGRIVTTIPQVTLTVAINDDTAGFDPDALHWSVGSLDSGIAAPGTFQQNALGQFVATLPLGVGLNHLQIQASDRVGNVGSKVVALYRVPGHNVSTNRGDRVTGVDFGNSGLGSIQGVKYDDLNQNGARDFAEPGIAGVTIYADSNENGILDPSEPTAITSDRGEYRFDNVFGGDYIVREVVPLGWAPTGPVSGQQLVTIGAGENLEDVDFGNAFLGATLGGTVYEDENGNGHQDLGEAGLDGWEVALDIDGDGSKDAFTNSGPDGSYMFSELDAGSYAVSIAGQAGWIGSTDDRILTTIADGEVIDKLDFGVFRQAEIAGVVFDDENGNGLQDAGESNLVGWEIRIDLGNDGSVDQTLLTNTRGFTVTDVPPGTHRIQVVDQPGVRRTVPAKTDSYVVTVESDSVVDGILFGQQDRRSEILGTKFFDRNGDSIRQGDEPGLAGWTIYADLNDNETLDDNEPRTVSDDDGNYALRVVAGEYIVREVQQDGWVQTFPRSFTTEAITDNDQLNLSPKVAGDYVAWVEFDDPKRLLLSDGVSTQVIVEGDIALPYFDLDASGHVVWSQTVSAPGEGDDLELFFWDGSVRKHTRNSVDDVRPVLVDGKIAWQSGSSVLLDEGDRTLVLSQTAGFPEFDGEGVVFFGDLPESQRSGLVYYDGVSVRMLSDPSQSVSPLSRIAGQYVVWTDLQNDYSVHLYDGQSTIELAGPGMGGLADVDESGNVVWLRRYDDQGSDVMFYNGVETIQLTHDGSPKDSLSIDDGIAAWSTDGESTASVSIFDGRQIRTPDFFASSSPVRE